MFLRGMKPPSTYTAARLPTMPKFDLSGSLPLMYSSPAMSQAAADTRKRVTWNEYQTWDDERRWEILAGQAYMMAGPSYRHQKTLTDLSRQMATHFQGKTCEVLIAPLDVVLSDEDVVQPDLMVICDRHQIKPTHIEGPPSLIVEIISTHSVQRDRLLKLNLYARHGVQEYWMISPDSRLVEVLVLQGSHYFVHGVFGATDTLTSPTFPDLNIKLADIFNYPPSSEEPPPAVAESPAAPYQSSK
jgi:Uma2 family endonuclease